MPESVRVWHRCPELATGPAGPVSICLAPDRAARVFPAGGVCIWDGALDLSDLVVLSQDLGGVCP